MKVMEIQLYWKYYLIKHHICKVFKNCQHIFELRQILTIFNFLEISSLLNLVNKNPEDSYTEIVLNMIKMYDISGIKDITDYSNIMNDILLAQKKCKIYCFYYSRLIRIYSCQKYDEKLQLVKIETLFNPIIQSNLYTNIFYKHQEPIDVTNIISSEISINYIEDFERQLLSI